ncbi:YjdF family protein [Pseudobacillus sp. FSL P4-0506]|uniref:YjdF family protein n=1 Tax=unclassified Pseudobacillus TaxID=2619284 RepID=UPI0030F7ABF9
MKLTISYNGQFYVGIIEVVSQNTLKAYRYIFGAEPKEQEIMDFVNKDLLRFIERHDQKGITIQQDAPRKVNPKRLQRMVAKEMKQSGISTKAQEAIKEEYAQRKKEKSGKIKQIKDELKQFKRDLKIQKAKNKHKGK